MSVKKISGLILMLLLVSFNVMSQECEFDGTDPGIPGDPDDLPCEIPLDTWVYVLVIAAVVFGTYQLYKKQKSLSA